jgi:prepilin-type processing-associated H-X9-DG protein
MYKFLGSDQREYGPVSADQIRAWIAQGRANARSQVQAADSTQWKPLSDFPEFAEALNAAPGAGASPALPAAPQSTPTPAKLSGLAVTSLVLGCLGLFSCGITSVVGLVLGIVAMSRISKSKGQLGGQGVALAGTIVSAAFLFLGLMAGALLLPALAKAKSKAQGINCMNNVNQLNLALLMYASDNKEAMPNGAKWCDAITVYLGGSSNAFICPAGPPQQRSGYALNASLAGHSTSEVTSPAQTVLVFECDGGWNVSGGRQLLPARPRHGNAYTIGFADGHVEMVKPERVARLRWEP